MISVILVVALGNTGYSIESLYMGIPNTNKLLLYCLIKWNAGDQQTDIKGAHELVVVII